MLRAGNSDAVLLVCHGNEALDLVARTAIVAVVVVVIGVNVVIDLLVEDLNQVVVVLIDLFYVRE